MDENRTYPDHIIHLATFLDALSHPARLEIVEYLASHSECPAGSISDKLPLCKSSVSQHLSKLKETGIISCNPQGICLEYSINNEVFEIFKSNFLDFIEHLGAKK